MTEAQETQFCPCGLKQAFEACCGAFISGKAIPDTPEALMRSRYTAFTLADVDYIEKTMKGNALKDFDKPSTKAWAERAEWLGLEVIESGQQGDHGAVEFVASFREKGVDKEIHECSMFAREGKHWYYMDADNPVEQIVRDGPKVGRNDPCPCGSGKKHKKCCLK